jgi:hypothetical protein
MEKHHKQNWLSLAEARLYIGLSISTLRKAINNGLLKHKRLNGYGKIMIHRQWLDAYILGYDAKRLTRPQKHEITDLQED